MFDSALLLPAHGHAPHLIGTRLLRKLATHICIPEYYGEDQRAILRDEFPGETGRIFLSESMGALLQPLLLGRQNSSQGKSSARIDLYASQVRKHFESINLSLGQMLESGIEAVSLDGVRRKFSRFDFALNTGLPVYSSVKPVYYAFVSRLSQIYEFSPYQSPGVSFLKETWQGIEASFDHMFVPRLHSLYECKDFDSTGITLTPPFAHPVPVNQDDSSRILHGSTLVIVSGTGMDLGKLIDLVRASPGRPWVTLPESPEALEEDLATRVSPRSWGNPKVVAVLARSGLGSIWQAALNEKPIGVVMPVAEDDPEVYHNAQMVEKAKIGKILADRIDPLIESLSEYSSGIQRQLQLEVENFGTTDGIEYTAAKLKERLEASIAE